MQNDEIKKALGKKLKALHPKATSDDRKAIMKQFGISYPTTNRYLAGLARNPNLGIKMYKFLTELIEEREALLLNTGS